jgi:hypothetical protein
VKLVTNDTGELCRAWEGDARAFPCVELRVSELPVEVKPGLGWPLKGTQDRYGFESQRDFLTPTCRTCRPH